jgi:hypothetical protein
MGMRKKKGKLKESVIAIRKTLAPSEMPMGVITPGGRIQVQWDKKANATAMGQLAFFAGYLETTGLFERWVEGCPLHYTSPNAPTVRNVLGTWLLSILDGQRRYAHVACLRGDAVAPEILGLTKIIGDESLRRALGHIAPAPKANPQAAKDSSKAPTEGEEHAGESHPGEEEKQQQAQLALAEAWMRNALLESVQHALERNWILDIDTTVKTLYGKQSGAQVSYNPRKPGRPSHAIHTYWVANLRLVLHAHVQAGTAQSSAETLPGLLEALSSLPKEKWPKLVRGDCGFGNERMMRALEDLQQSYLFKLKQSGNVKKLIERQWQRTDPWQDAGQGWEAREDQLTLVGWSCARRVIVMRQAVRADMVVASPETGKGKIAASKGKKKEQEQEQQLSLHFIDENEPTKLWKYAVLVTNSNYSVAAMGQLYRDRADCENGFDELKNQWGWGGYSTQDIERCNLSARAVALVYNWWSWYVRLANPDGRLEAITSRPLLLAAVGRITTHSGQTRVLLSITHAAADKVKALVENVQKGLQHVLTTAPQLPPIQRWKVLVRYIVDKIFEANTRKAAKTTAPPALAMG